MAEELTPEGLEPRGDEREYWKGVRFNDKLYTWKTDNGAPHHYQGLIRVDPYAELTDTQGQYWGNHERHNMSVPPELRDEFGYDEPFGNFMGSNRVPEVTTLDIPREESLHYRPAFPEEWDDSPRSFFYDPDENKVWTGPSYIHHADIADALNKAGIDTEGFHAGLYGEDGLDYYGPDEHEPTLQEAWGADDPWHFGNYVTQRQLNPWDLRLESQKKLTEVDISDDDRVRTPPDTVPWELGEYGKGYYDPELDQLNHWMTDGFDGNPWHAEIAGGDYEARRHMPAFEIKPNGAVEWYPGGQREPSDRARQLALSIPGTNPDEFDSFEWGSQFSKVAQYNIERKDEPLDRKWGWDKERRPLLFHPESQTIYIGPGGRHHQEAARMFGIDQEPYFEGVAHEAMPPHVQKPYFNWFGAQQSPGPEGNRQLAQHLGWDDYDDHDVQAFGEDWHGWGEKLGASTKLEPWELGKAGKGILWPSGEVNTWATTGRPGQEWAGFPHHGEVFRQQGVDRDLNHANTFVIRRDGTVEYYDFPGYPDGQEEAEPLLTQHNPNLKMDRPEDWKISGLNLPEVIESGQGGSGGMVEQGRPFVYYPDRHLIYIGDVHDLHQAIVPGGDKERMQGLSGRIGNGQLAFYDHNWGARDWEPAEQELVTQALKPYDEHDGDEWNFEDNYPGLNFDYREAKIGALVVDPSKLSPW
jgi:hypothetical protein